eukprot:1934008-Amphidinium_carterae.1
MMSTSSLISGRPMSKTMSLDDGCSPLKRIKMENSKNAKLVGFCAVVRTVRRTAYKKTLLLQRVLVYVLLAKP